MPVIAIDLGGTKLAAAIVSDEGEIVISETQWLQKRTGREVAGLVIEQAGNMLKKAVEKDMPATALGVCVPGISYSGTQRVWAPNIPGWDDYPLLEELQNGLPDKNLKIKIDSDRACYISGEVWKGNAAGCRDAIYLSVGTGIGAGILVNNEVLRGAHDIAGAIGWMALERPFENKFISCGCFEYGASGDGIARVAKEYLSNAASQQSALAGLDEASITAEVIFQALENGDRLAMKVIANAIEYWGMAVANLVSLFNPEKIIFGGGVFGPAVKFLDAIYAEAKKWAQPISILQVELLASALGNKAGLYGAAYLALKDRSNN